MSDVLTSVHFPCEFPIKVMGKAHDEFEKAVLAIIHKHVPDLKEGAIATRLSHHGNYLALTVTVNAASKAHIDAIYQELTRHKEVLWAL